VANFFRQKITLDNNMPPHTIEYLTTHKIIKLFNIT